MFLKLNPNIIEIGNLSIAWYAVLIIGGAILCYLVANRMATRAGFSKDLFGNIFFLCFPMGIIGARLWFVLSNLDMYRGADWYRAFFIWEGGLAIQGGVVLAVVAAVIYLRKKEPDLSVLQIFDFAVPNILLGQAIGRWGNFFNQEVYGACVSRDTLSFLPRFILDQMAGGGGIACGVSQVAQPLFLYESLFNLIGWLILSFLLRYKWTKRRPHGVLTALYFVYYGIVRACLEPLRNEMFIMRIGGVSTSVATSIVFVVLGLAAIVAIYVFDAKKSKMKKTKNDEEKVVEENAKK